MVHLHRTSTSGLVVGLAFLEASERLELIECPVTAGGDLALRARMRGAAVAAGVDRLVGDRREDSDRGCAGLISERKKKSERQRGAARGREAS